MRLAFFFRHHVCIESTSRRSWLVIAMWSALGKRYQRHEHTWRPGKSAGVWKVYKSSIGGSEHTVWACTMVSGLILTRSTVYWRAVTTVSEIGPPVALRFTFSPLLPLGAPSWSSKSQKNARHRRLSISQYDQRNRMARISIRNMSEMMWSNFINMRYKMPPHLGRWRTRLP